jgi:hypothetical protein
MLFTGEVALLCGDREHAVAIHAAAAQPPPAEAGDKQLEWNRKVEERLRFLRDEAQVASPEEAAVTRRIELVARDLYAGDLEAARRALAELDDGGHPGVAFYRGEHARLARHPEAALAGYAALTREAVPARWRFFKILAFARSAEIHAAAGDRRAAVRALEQLLEYDHDRDLLRHALRARHRFFEQSRDRSPDNAIQAAPPPTAR